VSVLSKVSVEHSPPALTALVKVVARKQHLGRELRDLLVPILKPEPCLHDLSEADGVAASAVLLIPHYTPCKIMPIKTPVVIDWRDLFIFNLVGRGVVLLP